MQAENSNMIFHSFSWGFLFGREILSHELWQKHHPTSEVTCFQRDPSDQQII